MGKSKTKTKIPLMREACKTSRTVRRTMLKTKRRQRVPVNKDWWHATILGGK